MPMLRERLAADILQGSATEPAWLQACLKLACVDGARLPAAGSLLTCCSVSARAHHPRRALERRLLARANYSLVVLIAAIVPRACRLVGRVKVWLARRRVGASEPALWRSLLRTPSRGTSSVPNASTAMCASSAARRRSKRCRNRLAANATSEASRHGVGPGGQGQSSSRRVTRRWHGSPNLASLVGEAEQREASAGSEVRDSSPAKRSTTSNSAISSTASSSRAQQARLSNTGVAASRAECARSLLGLGSHTFACRLQWPVYRAGDAPRAAVPRTGAEGLRGVRCDVRAAERPAGLRLSLRLCFIQEALRLLRRLLRPAARSW